MYRIDTKPEGTMPHNNPEGNRGSASLSTEIVPSELEIVPSALEIVPSELGLEGNYAR